jgi:uncharacterized protein (DUF736 family)
MTAIGYVIKNENGGYKGLLKTASYRVGADIDILPNRDESADTHHTSTLSSDGSRRALK